MAEEKITSIDFSSAGNVFQGTVSKKLQLTDRPNGPQLLTITLQSDEPIELTVSYTPVPDKSGEEPLIAESSFVSVVLAGAPQGVVFKGHYKKPPSGGC